MSAATIAVLLRFKQIINAAYNYQEAIERENLKQENIQLLREKVKSSDLVPKSLIDRQLLLFLNAGKNDVEKSAKILHNFYKVKKLAPEFFSFRDTASFEIQNCLDNQHYVVLPITPKNCHLIFHRLSSFDTKTYNFDAAAKTFIILSEASAYEHGPRSGITFLFDLTGVSFIHLFKPSISSMRKGIKFLEEGMPFEIEAVHVLNAGRVFDFILAIVKPLVRSEMLNKVHFYRSNIDYEKFYKNCIPRSHLPSDFGGDLESVKELHEKQRKTLLKMRDYFFYEEMQANLDFDDFVNDFLDDVNC